MGTVLITGSIIALIGILAIVMIVHHPSFTKAVDEQDMHLTQVHVWFDKEALEYVHIPVDQVGLASEVQHDLEIMAPNRFTYIGLS